MEDKSKRDTKGTRHIFPFSCGLDRRSGTGAPRSLTIFHPPSGIVEADYLPQIDDSSDVGAAEAQLGDALLGSKTQSSRSLKTECFGWSDGIVSRRFSWVRCPFAASISKATMQAAPAPRKG